MTNAEKLRAALADLRADIDRVIVLLNGVPQAEYERTFMEMINAITAPTKTGDSK